MNSDMINHQDWTTVTLKRRPIKKESQEAEINERNRIAKLESAENVIIKKSVQPESLQVLIRKRIEMKLNQEKADQLCSFPRHTFKEIEANRAVPTQEQQSRIQRHFGVQIKINTEKMLI
jgi:DNA-binding XRE family transcriptional regulator